MKYMFLLSEEPNFLNPVPENFEVFSTSDFDRSFKQLKMTDDDFNELKQAIKDESPEASLGASIYKFRWVPKRLNQGQSKSYRVFYVNYIKLETIYFLDIISKSEQSDITDRELRYLKSIVKRK